MIGAQASFIGIARVGRGGPLWMSLKGRRALAAVRAGRSGDPCGRFQISGSFR